MTPNSDRLRGTWRAWKRLAERIARVQARALLAIFYVVILPPFAICARYFSDPLRLRRGKAVGWTPCDVETRSSLDDARRQF